MLLAAPVPNPGPIGPYGTMPWLGAMVPRFANGEAHARRRELVEALLADMDPMALREDAAAMARCAGERQSSGTMREAVDVRAIETPYLPVAVLARRLGVPPARLADAVAATRVVAAAYQPHTAHPDAGAALTRLLALLPGGPEEVVAARICILVQGCEATAGLVPGEDV